MAIKRFRIPGLQIPANADGEMLAFFNAVKERLELSSGERGDPEQRAVTLRDIKDAGLAEVQARNQYASLVAPRTPGSAGSGQETTRTEPLDFTSYQPVSLESVDGTLYLLAQGVTTSDRVRILLADFLNLFIRRDQAVDLDYPVSFRSVEHGFSIEGTAPKYRFIELAEEDEAEAARPADENVWDVEVDESSLSIYLVSDDEGTRVCVLRLDRTGTNGDVLNILVGSLEHNGEQVIVHAGDGLLKDGDELAVDLAFDFGWVGLHEFEQTPTVPDESWTYAKIQNSTALSVLGRSADTDGVLSEIAASADKAVLHRDGAALTFSPIDSSFVADFAEAVQGVVEGIDLTWSGEHIFTLLTRFTDDVDISGDGLELAFGADRDLILTHDGTNALVTNITGYMQVQGSALRVVPDSSVLPAGAVNPDSVLVVGKNSTSVSIGLVAPNGGSNGFRFVNAAGGIGALAAINTVSNTYLAFVGGAGYDGTNWQTGSSALFGIRPGSTWSPTNRHSYATIEVTPSGSIARSVVAQFDRPSTATQTGLMLWDVDSGTLKRVTVGAADSGGAGFKVLRIPN